MKLAALRKSSSTGACMRMLLVISFCATWKLTTKIDGTFVKTQILRDSRILHQGASTGLVFRVLIGSLPGYLYSTHSLGLFAAAGRRAYSLTCW